jgi:hypothetical protein
MDCRAARQAMLHAQAVPAISFLLDWMDACDTLVW